MDEVDAAFILPASNQSSYKRWSSAVNASLEVKSFDEVDSSVSVLPDRSYDVTSTSAQVTTLTATPVTEDKSSDHGGYAVVSPSELALQLSAGLDKVSFIGCMASETLHK